MADMPGQYYERFDPAKEYDEHLFIAGRGLQSAELNEIQKQAATRLRGVSDALFKDGDIIRDAAVVVNQDTGVTQCGSGAIYLRGAVRGVAPATFTIPLTGTVAIGVRLIDSVVSEVQDPDLKDPATGTRNYDQPGANRLKVHTLWGWDGDGTVGEFFPVYSVIDSVLGFKEPPPNLDAVTQALARYDRDSAGGTYVVFGLGVTALPDVGANQTYSLAEGRARVYGYNVDLSTSRRLSLAAVPDLKPIANEPHLSTTAAAQRVNLDRAPGTNITVSITAEKTVSLVHGVFVGAQDQLPDTSVLSIISVTQGATTYAATTSYLLTAGKVDWSPGGAEPSPGSTYNVTYRYITPVTPTAVDDSGFTVTGAVSGTLVLITYNQKLPRYDRLCLTSDGEAVWMLGVASDTNPQLPSVPPDQLVLASVYQTWDANRRISNDGVRVVPMPQLAAIEGRLDLLMQLIAQNRLESAVHTREAGAKKGLFTDPFLDDFNRDAGIAQTAAVVRGELVLPITATIGNVSADIDRPRTCSYGGIIALQQPLRTGDMKINPYMSFSLVPASVTLTPAVDRWTQVVTDWASPTTERFTVGQPRAVFGGTNPNSVMDEDRDVRNALINTTRSNIENLRPISVAFRVEGFGPGEVLQSLTFDGITVATGNPAANSSGVVTGSFMIPAGVPAGNKSVRVTGAGGITGSAVFSGQGTLERQVWQQQTTIVTTWSSPPPPAGSGGAVFGPSGGAVFGGTSSGRGEGGDRSDSGIDPLAQTFILETNTQVAGIDLWFAVAPTTETRVQIRETSNGMPNSTVRAEVRLPPGSITANAFNTIAFVAPPLLLGGVEYAVAVLCNDAVGSLGVAELGKFDAGAQRWITSQPYTVGVLLSSSNNLSWTVHQDRDMTFRILRANFTQTALTLALGTVAVVGATDLLLMSFASRPASATGVEYTLTLPDASVVTVSDGQPIQLPAAITGNVAVAARLTGTADFAPILTPGTQLVAGVIANSGTYVSRAVPAGTGVNVKVIYEAVVPSGATILVEYKGIDPSDTTWIAVPQISTRAVDDGFVEFIHEKTPVTETAVQIRITLNGTTVARPRVRDLRIITI